jgi:hypothetical protein
MGSSPGLLESIIEKIRGCTLTPYQCRFLASAYAEFQRGMQSCGSIAERDDLYKMFERSVQVAFYGEPNGCTSPGGRVATELPLEETRKSPNR